MASEISQPSVRSPRVLYITCAENGLYGLRRLMQHGLSIAAVVTISPDVAQKHNVSGYADVRPYCKSQNVPVICLATYTMTAADIRAVSFDLVIVNGWNRLLPDEIIASAPLGALGIHAGHPPIGHGRAPLVWNIILGWPDIEVYVFRLTPKADDGDILALQPVEITPQDDVRALYEKVMMIGADLFLRAIVALQRGERGRIQYLAAAKPYGKRTPEDGLIDFSRSESEVYNFIRAQAPPYPGAFAHLDGAMWTILQAQPFDKFSFRDRSREPGLILAALPSGLVVQTGGSPIWLRAASIDGNPAPFSDTEKFERLVGRKFC